MFKGHHRPAREGDIYRQGSAYRRFRCDESLSDIQAINYRAPKKGDWFLKPIGVRRFFRLVKAQKDYPIKHERYILWTAEERPDEQ